MNKPKDFITTIKDPKGRKTVMDLFGDAVKERIYPVGRLDRNTTGVLLFTNDGDLTKKLTHPEKKIPKVYISHLVYSGRGLDNLKMDITKKQRKEAVDFIIDKAFYYHKNKIDIEIVTGNMEMDAIVFLEKFAKRYPDLKDEMVSRLKRWGGNSAGRKLLNINSEGDVKPDPFFPITIGNILKEDFSDIWTKKPSDILVKLREHPRELKGICKNCEYLDICNGGSRSRAYAISGDLWAEDPSCYIKGDLV